MAFGVSNVPFRDAAGDQYPAVSLGTRHVVPPASIDSTVELAFTVVFPKKSCRCASPG